MPDGLRGGRVKSDMNSRVVPESSCLHYADGPALPFSDARLNTVARYVRKFLGGSFDWYHLVLGDRVRFDRWTLTVFGRDERGRYHYVKACPTDTFVENVWEKLDRARVSSRCVSWIGNPVHLIRVLVDICDLPFLGYELPPDSLWVLASLWKDGLRTLLEGDEEKLPPPRFCFPVRKHFKPTKKGPTDYFLYLSNGSPLYFEKDDSLRNLNEREWTELQLKLGNELI